MIKIQLTFVTFFLLLISCDKKVLESEIEFTNYEGPYMGQTPPGNIPQSFLSNIFHDTHSSPVFSPDCKEVYWAAHQEIHLMWEIDGKWTEPQHIKLIPNSEIEDVPFLTNDGNRLYFSAITNNNSVRENGIYYVERINSEWSEAISVGNNINNNLGHWQFSASENGTIYYPGLEDNFFIHVSSLENNSYQTPTIIFPSIEAGFPYISKDEEYIIFASSFESNQFLDFSLYISFRDANGNWGEILI